MFVDSTCAECYPNLAETEQTQAKFHLHPKQSVVFSAPIFTGTNKHPTALCWNLLYRIYQS